MGTRISGSEAGDLTGLLDRGEQGVAGGGEPGVLPGGAVGEDDDVTTVHGGVGPVDDDPVADLERLLHRLGRHSERLDDEGLHEGDRDDGEEDLEPHGEPATGPRALLGRGRRTHAVEPTRTHAPAPPRRTAGCRFVCAAALGHPWGMVALILGMLICVGLALVVVALVAVPARRDGRGILTPKGEEVVTALKERQQSARDRLDRGSGDRDGDSDHGAAPLDGPAPLTARSADTPVRA